MLDREDVKHAISMIPNCETQVVSGAGHFLHFERPEILDLYDEFYSRAT